MRNELRAYTNDVLSPRRISRTGLFDPGYVSTKLRDHLEGRAKNNKLLFAMIMFQHWHDRYMQ
jgi:asparagine synthase (glutamine-hydrolysing)